MIAYVSGKLIQKEPEEVIVDVQGLGYRVQIPTSTYEKLPEPGKPVKLHTYHYVREDAIQLYGFASNAERAVFETMLGVSRVGPSLALSTLSAMNPSELRDHVLQEDTGVLTNISGVGKKTARRLVVELKDRLADLDVFEGVSKVESGSAEKTEARDDALAALQSLGLTKADAERALRKALRDNSAIRSADELVRLALKER